jgi:hypothetical protein
MNRAGRPPGSDVAAGPAPVGQVQPVEQRGQAELEELVEAQATAMPAATIGPMPRTASEFTLRRAGRSTRRAAGCSATFRQLVAMQFAEAGDVVLPGYDLAEGGPSTGPGIR